jgi:hypothetical protein
MPVIQSSAVIGKNEDGSDITQDVDVLVWWRDVERARFPRIAVMTRQFLAIPPASATAERLFHTDTHIYLLSLALALLIHNKHNFFF